MTLHGCRILLVDDHAVVRAGLAAILGSLGADVCGQAEDAPTALAAEAELRPDVVITDMAMPGPSGLQLARQLKRRRPDLAVLILSSFDESLFAEQSVAAGASGYVMKDVSPDELARAVERVHQGRLHFSEEMWDQIGVPDKDVALGPLHEQVLQALGVGNRPLVAIADELGLTVGVVERVVTELMRMLETGTLVGLRVLAAQRLQA